jgi:SAM-dependent methyltransferase
VLRSDRGYLAKKLGCYDWDVSGFVNALAQKFYPELQNRWDDTFFRQTIDQYLKPTDAVLDLGAGRGIVPQMNFLGAVRFVAGVDTDDCVLSNPYLHEPKVAGGDSIPYADSTFDVVVSNNVLEHLRQPEKVFAEVRRVLKPEGVFLAKTPNRLHYVPLVSALTPHWFHQWFIRKHGGQAEDVYPTYYRANSRRQVERLARVAGLKVRKITTFEGRPEYLRSTALTYAAGIIYERLVNSTEVLRDFRVILVAALSKPKDSA